MTKYQRAAQLWSVLAFAARHQHILSYEVAEQLTGLDKAGVGANLGPIQDYCKQNGLPPLTALVVRKDTGLPAEGFDAAPGIPSAQVQARVFVYDWLTHKAPTPDDFERAWDKAKH